MNEQFDAGRETYIDNLRAEVERLQQRIGQAEASLIAMDKLTAENARLRAALGWYADHANWEIPNANLPFRKETRLVNYPELDGWAVAEEALKGGEG